MGIFSRKKKLPTEDDIVKAVYELFNTYRALQEKLESFIASNLEEQKQQSIDHVEELEELKKEYEEAVSEENTEHQAIITSLGNKLTTLNKAHSLASKVVNFSEVE